MFILKKAKKIVGWKIVFDFYKKKPIKENTILFESFLGRSYSDNPKYIFEYIERNNQDYDLVWVMSNPKEIKGAKVIRKKSLKYIQYLATSKIIITNSRLPEEFNKREEQIYFQTWHGTPLKKLVYDINDIYLSKNQQYFLSFSKDVSEWDFLLSANEFSTTTFKSTFRYDGEILEIGYPRNDILINHNDEKITEIKNNLKIKENKKILLYTPTYRDNEYNDKDKYIQKIMIDINKIEKLAPDWMILLRTHYLVNKNIGVNECENIIDVTYYDDINDLYLISDCLMTDYSSSFFDYSILKKPQIFYAYDLLEYEKNIRGFYFDYEELIPGKNIRDTEELIYILNNIKEYEKKYKEKIEKFNKKFNSLEDGESSKRLVKQLNL